MDRHGDEKSDELDVPGGERSSNVTTTDDSGDSRPSNFAQSGIAFSARAAGDEESERHVIRQFSEPASDNHGRLAV